jgi:hypothetical protein
MMALQGNGFAFNRNGAQVGFTWLDNDQIFGLVNGDTFHGVHEQVRYQPHHDHDTRSSRVCSPT